VGTVALHRQGRCLAQFRPQRTARRRLSPCKSASPGQEPKGADGFHHHGARRHAAYVGLELDLRRDRAARRRHTADAGARLALEAPGGLIAVTAECRNGKAERISIENVPSFADRLDAPLEVAGLGALKVDIAYGGDSFVIVAAAAVGFAIRPDEARDLAGMGVRIIAAANEQLGFTHPQATGWDHISFCQFVGPLMREGNELHGPNAVVVRPGKIDRSPTGTGCSARMAVLSARGLMEEGDIYRARSMLSAASRDGPRLGAD
jgi:hypothetical protein